MNIIAAHILAPLADALLRCLLLGATEHHAGIQMAIN
jgi:hypothetical protein